MARAVQGQLLLQHLLRHRLMMYKFLIDIVHDPAIQLEIDIFRIVYYPKFRSNFSVRKLDRYQTLLIPN